jgi:D-glycero-alpha-D-manno-heptose 1-phosphate guanylyltransferase
MEAIILAGGFGTRLQATVPDLPKPMAPVAGRPFLEILLTVLARKGFRRVVLSLGYSAEKITAHFGTRFGGIDLVYEIEKTPFGTGGALRQALTHCREDHVYAFNGDTLLELDVAAIEGYWRQHHRPIVIAREVPDTSRYGRIEIDGNRIISFSEKGVTGPGLINAGCYVMPKDLLDEFPLGKNFSMETNFLAPAVKRMRIDCLVSHGTFIDIGSPEDYARAQTELGGIADAVR